MIYIYALVSDDLVLYVGKTKRLKRREREHRNGSSRCSQYIQEYPDWIMKVLEETTGALGTEREQYFYDTLDPLYNTQRPGQTRKEYGQTYEQTDARKANQKANHQTEAYKASKKAYRQTDAYKAYMKAYYLKNKS